MTSKRIIREGYISELDQFLREYDKQRGSYSPARMQEKMKHQKIAAKRDGVESKHEHGDAQAS